MSDYSGAPFGYGAVLRTTFAISGMMFLTPDSTGRLFAYDSTGDYHGQTTVRVDINEFRQLPDPIHELELMKQDVELNLRAESLMKEVLGKGRYLDFIRTKQLTVPSKLYKDRYYIVREYGRVEVVENGKTTDELCLVSKDYSLVAQDIVALKKLMLEGDEQRFLEVANHFPRHDRNAPMSDMRRSLWQRLGWR